MRHQNLVILSIITLAGIIKLLLTPYFTSYGDLLTYQIWGENILRFGPQNFYSRLWCDYLPGYLYLLWLASYLRIELLPSLNLSVEFAYKFFPILFDLGTAWYVFQIAKCYTNTKISFYLFIFYLLNLPLLANSTFWGQSESIVAFFLISSFYYLITKRFFIAFTLLALCQITKPIAIISLPIYLGWLTYQRIPYPKIVLYLLNFAAICLVVFIPFTYHDYGIVQTLLLRHTTTFDQYQYTSLRAFSFWGGITQFWFPDQTIFLGLTLKIWGYILWTLSTLVPFVYLYFRKFLKIQSLLIVQSINYFAMFMFITRMHERHLFYGLVFTLIAWPLFNRLTRILIGICLLVYSLNLYYAFSQTTSYVLNLDPTTISFLSMLNLLTLISIIYTIFHPSFYESQTRPAK